MFEMQRRAIANSLSSFLVKFGSLTIAFVSVVMMMIVSKTRSMVLIFNNVLYICWWGENRANETFDVINKTFPF